jgi:ADP-heptose:LPS heptosyltransferase
VTTHLLIFPRDPQAAILATPAIDAIKAALGDSRIVGVFSARAAELFRYDSRFHALAVRPDVNTLLGWAELGRFTRGLEEEHGPFEWVINLEPLSASAWLAWRIKGANRLSVKTTAMPPFGWQHKPRVDEQSHRCAQALEAVAPIAQADSPYPPRIAIEQNRRAEAIGICAGGDRQDRWGVHHWAECALSLSDHAPLRLFADAGGLSALDRMESVLLYNEVRAFESFGNERSLQGILSAFSRLKLFIGEDGLLTQMALALQIPTVVLVPEGKRVDGPFCHPEAVMVPREVATAIKAAEGLLAKSPLDPITEQMP